MLLDDWLKQNEVSINALAKSTGLPYSTVYAAATGHRAATRGKTKRVTSPRTAKTISEATGGAVTVGDIVMPQLERKAS